MSHDLKSHQADASEPNKPSPFCLRLSLDEREKLEREAAGLSLGEHIRRVLFNTDKPTRRTRMRFPVKDHAALAEVLGKLGQSRLASNVNQIALAINTGTLVVSPEVKRDILSAQRDIADIRRLLNQALGLGLGD